MNSLQEKSFKLTNFIPTMLVEKDGEAVTKMENLEPGDELTVTLSGFEVKDEYTLISSLTESAKSLAAICCYL